MKKTSHFGGYWLAVLLFAIATGAQAASIGFTEGTGRVDITCGDTVLASYIYKDAEIPRPYFAHLKTTDGIQVTRNHPPQAGDPDDHATFHPGLWLAFGDISGSDFWRNRAEVVHRRFVQPPTVGTDGALAFTVENAYIDGTKVICEETCAYRIALGEKGWVLSSDSSFKPLVQAAIFGDQEEMGFGVRMATPLAVRQGGTILNSEGGKDEEGVWGKPAPWADYSGKIGEAAVGVTLMAHPDNFRPSWFHARDYGLLVANPFGQKAFTEGEASQIEATTEKPLRVRFAAFIHGEASGEALKSAYNQFVAEGGQP